MPNSERRASSRLDEHAARDRATARRTALVVAALLVVALLAPFVTSQLAG